MNKYALRAIIAGVALVVVGSITGYVIIKDRQASDTPSPTPSPIVEYRNEQYGLAVKLPVTWQGFTTFTGTYDIINISSGAREGTGVVMYIRHPQWTQANQRADIPVMIFTPTNWDRVQNKKISVGAAPIPPSLLAQNAEYVFALPARYNYEFKTGWEEVEQIVHGNSVQAFEPSAQSSNWKTYRSSQYGFELQYPAAWTATQNNENWNNKGVVVVHLASPEHVEAMKTCGIPCEAVPYTLSVIVSTRNDWTLDRYVAEESELDSKTSITLGGVSALEGRLGGFSTYYVVYAEKNGRIYELFFDNTPDKSHLTSEEKYILSTFTFAK